MFQCKHIIHQPIGYFILARILLRFSVLEAWDPLRGSQIFSNEIQSYKKNGSFALSYIHTKVNTKQINESHIPSLTTMAQVLAMAQSFSYRTKNYCHGSLFNLSYCFMCLWGWILWSCKTKQMWTQIHNDKYHLNLFMHCLATIRELLQKRIALFLLINPWYCCMCLWEWIICSCKGKNNLSGWSLATGNNQPR